MPNPAIGRIVHYRLPDRPNQELPILRPALITRVHTDGAINLMVTLDGGGDTPTGRLPYENYRDGMHVHCTSVPEGVEPGNWRWPEIR